MYNDNSRHWESSLSIGTKGEHTFAEIWQDCFGGTPQDITHDATYQKVDIDFLAPYDNDYITTEVKTDRRDMPNRVIPSSGSFLVETVKNLTLNRPGWIYETDADLIAIIKQQVHRMYLLSAAYLKDYVDTHKDKYLANHWYYDCPNYRDDGSIKYKSRNLIIARADIVPAIWKICLPYEGRYYAIGANDVQDDDLWYSLCTSTAPNENFL